MDVRCQYVLPKKNRQCRMLVKRGNAFCGEHAIFEPENSDRVWCPLDPKHSVLKDELESHLKSRCNSRFIAQEYLAEKVNAVKGETGFYDHIDRRPEEGEIAKVVEILVPLEQFLTSSIEKSHLSVDVLDAYLEESTNLGDSKRKHVHQISSILGNMRASGLLLDETSTCVCDLGAGKAQLSYWAAQMAPSIRYLLVDRMGSRNKWDNRLHRERPELSMTRLRCSIENLDMSKVPEIQQCTNVVAICKHLCGSATDSAVRCVTRLQSNGDSPDSGPSVNGLVLAPCCAHKARYDEYLGRSLLAEHGLDSPELFSALRHIATWAVCGLSEKDDDGYGGWSSAQKGHFGRLAKSLIELGRAKNISERGYSCRVVEYVDRTVSPENLLILANKV